MLNLRVDARAELRSLTTNPYQILGEIVLLEDSKTSSGHSSKWRRALEIATEGLVLGTSRRSECRRRLSTEESNQLTHSSRTYVHGRSC